MTAIPEPTRERLFMRVFCVGMTVLIACGCEVHVRREVRINTPSVNQKSNGPEGDYGPTRYRIDIQIAGWRPEKERELSEVRKFCEKNGLTLSVQNMLDGTARRIDRDVGVTIIENRDYALVEQQYGWGYWKEPLKEELWPHAGTEIFDSVGSKFPFEIIFAPLTAERLQKLWDERKPRTRDHYEGYVPRFNGTERQ